MSHSSEGNALYRAKRDFQRPTVLSKYAILGFLSSGTITRLAVPRPITSQLTHPSTGTYGRVYKARIRKATSDASPAGLMGTPGAATPGKRLKLSRDDGDVDDGELVAIKKFKPDKEGEAVTYTGISQSACREIMVGTRSSRCFGPRR